MSDCRTKFCSRCGKEFSRSKRESALQWEKRSYCSRSCINNGRIKIPLIDRFMSRWEHIPPSSCWIWNGPTDGHGYGLLAAKFKHSPIKAHRVSYELFVGNIPIGLVVRHKCDTPSCVNPNHLEVGTQKDNAMDTSKRGRLNPVSLLNLRPGQKGVLGAGTKSNKEIIEHVSE